MICIREDEKISRFETAVALGLFDGVHLGHRAVINQAVSQREKGFVPTVFSFETDSVTTKGHGGNIEMLLTEKDKHRHFESLGAEYVFSPKFSNYKDMSDEEFVKKVLKDKLNAGFAVCGEDFRFGKNAEGDAGRLKELGIKYGIRVCVVNELSVAGKAVSSTEIRKYIKNGEIAKANEMLGYRYGYTLPVLHGYERGRTWDFPTINQAIPKGLVLPKFGVYCSKVKIGDKLYSGVTNIGVKPTVKVETVPLAETYIIDYSGDLYGEDISIELYEFVRPERVFENFEELKAEIGRNTEFTKQYFSSNNL